MADDKLREKLADYVEDAHAMEQSVLRSLDSMISTTEDPQIRSMLEHHKEETERHQRLERLAERADDPETAEVARRNRADEEEMARKIDVSWDRVLDLTLDEAGIRAQENGVPVCVAGVVIKAPALHDQGEDIGLQPHRGAEAPQGR